MGLMGLDYAWDRPNLDTLWSLGYRFVCRYLSWQPNPKVITAAELKLLLDKGFGVFLNWEYDAGDAKAGAPGGVKDATEAIRQAKALGYPRGKTVYYSAGDYDVIGTGTLSAALAYVDAAAKLTRANGYRMGVYGNYHFLNELWKRGLIDDGWQSPSSFGLPGWRWDSRNSIHQIYIERTVANSDVDINRQVDGTQLHFWTKNSALSVTEDDMTPEQNVYFDSLVWRVAALIGDTPVVTGGNVKGEVNRLFRGPALIRQVGKGAIYEADGTARTRKWVEKPEDIKGRHVYDVLDVTVFGPVVGSDPGNV